MAITIKLKRGNKANLPSLSIGEPAFCLDTNELYVGTAGGNKLVGDGIYVKKSGDTMTGQLTLPGSPTQANHAVTKAYVDAVIESGRTIFISDVSPTPADGQDGDLWFEY
jgi:hypothetical protein